MVRRIQAIGILGMIFAVAGGIVWYFQQRLLGLMLWGVAGIIILKLNRQKKRSSKSKNKYQWLFELKKEKKDSLPLLDNTAYPIRFLLATTVPMNAITSIVVEPNIPNSGTTWVRNRLIDSDRFWSVGYSLSLIQQSSEKKWWFQILQVR